MEIWFWARKDWLLTITVHFGFLFVIFFLHQAKAWDFSVATICSPTPYFTLTLKVTRYLYVIRENSPLFLEEQSMGELKISFSLFCGQHITVQRALSQNGDTWGLTGSHAKGLTLASLCVPFLRRRVGSNYSSKGYFCSKTVELWMVVHYHPFLHYPYKNPCENFRLTFSDGKLPHRSFGWVASNPSESGKLLCSSVVQNGNWVYFNCSYLKCKC